MTKWRNLVAGGVILLVGCASSRPNVESLAAKLGEAGVQCKDLRIKPDVTVGREQGTCASGPDLLTITTFETNRARDAALVLGDATDGIAVLGDRWGVVTQSVAVARRVQEALGGQLA